MLGFIVNPVSGNGKGKKVWEQLEQALQGKRAHFLMRQTYRRGQAQKLAIELIQKEGVKKLIAVGGDGTVHEVINGIQKSGQKCVFGHVAAGSGNDYRITEEECSSVRVHHQMMGK
ncbi:diacylglycerol/lipid kinase family protein [Brevibacillus sp. SIMBA_040]